MVFSKRPDNIFDTFNSIFINKKFKSNCDKTKIFDSSDYIAGHGVYRLNGESFHIPEWSKECTCMAQRITHKDPEVSKNNDQFSNVRTNPDNVRHEVKKPTGLAKYMDYSSNSEGEDKQPTLL